MKTEKETHGFGAAINFVDEGMSLNAFTRTEPSHQRVQKVSLHVAQCLAQPGDRVLIYKPHKLLAALNQLVKHVWNRRFCSQQEKESCRAFKNVNFVDVGCERKICRNVVPLLSWPCLHNKLLQRKPDPVCNFQGICGSLTLFAELVSRNNGAKPSGQARTYTQEDIKNFYVDVRKGKFKGRDDERGRIERDIFAAQQEGRIVA